ncbi:MAG: TadA family conjugal transfer-associated ATPase [Frankiales bacterium]|nr:TadA family conjugal transfer-associated ATPase [Frankiales bacterium]
MTLDPGVVDRVRSRLVAGGAPPTTADVARALREDGVLLGAGVLLAEAERLHGELTGTGPLTPLLRDLAVTDVLVTGPGDVWVDRGAGVERVEVRFPDEAAVRRLAQRLASLAGRRLDDSAPYVDARLPDGTRLHAVLAPVARTGTTLSLRVPRRRAFTLDDLVRAGSLPAEVVPWVRAVVDARLAVLITGGTGTGKTTWLATLVGLCDPAERIVLVEDSAELAPEHPHVVALEARPANLEGAGAVTMRDLVRQSLRMRPDRIVVGEVRGAEIVDLLAALNTGHEGGCATVHANRAADVPARLESLALAAGLDRAAVHAQVAAGLDVVVHLVRDRDGLRRWRSLSLARRDADGWTVLVDALGWPRRDGPVVRGPAFDALVERLGRWAPTAAPDPRVGGAAGAGAADAS